MSILEEYKPNQSNAESPFDYSAFHAALRAHLAGLWAGIPPRLAEQQDYIEQIQYAANANIDLQRRLASLEDQGQPQSDTPSDAIYGVHMRMESEARMRCFVIDGVSFPPCAGISQHDYSHLFASMKHIVFRNCQFYCDNILNNVETYSLRFENCAFHAAWHPEFAQSCPQEAALYAQCNFTDVVTINSGFGGYFEVLFRDCCLQTLRLSDTMIESRVFDDSHHAGSSVANLHIHDCTLASPLEISSNQFVEIDVADCAFNGDVVLSDCHIGRLSIVKTRFGENALFTHAEIAHFVNDSVEYAGFAVFEGAIFGQEQNATQPMRIQLQNVTFHQAASFRDVEFRQQLDLRNTSFLHTPTFLGCRFVADTQRQTDRETFRIIKQAFTTVGNHIEANRFYVYEMEAYRRELAQMTTKSAATRCELGLITVNYWLSNHGQSYIRPIIWIVAIAGLSAALNVSGDVLWRTLPAYVQTPMASAEQILNVFAKGIIVLHPLLKAFPGHEFIALVVTLMLSACSWQFLVAIRRHTKR